MMSTQGSLRTEDESTRDILEKLDPILPPSEVHSTLVAVRTRHIKDAARLESMLRGGLVPKILALVEQGNKDKVVDIAFSILGNVMMEEMPKKQVGTFLPIHHSTYPFSFPPSRSVPIAGSPSSFPV